MSDTNGGALLTTDQVAERLSVAPDTVAGWRIRGGGPPFVRLGHRTVRYRAGDLERYLEQQVRANTSADAPPDHAG